jgi:hypothetical protein
MNIGNSNIVIVMLIVAALGVHILIIKYVRPFGLAVDKKLYKRIFGRTRLRKFGVNFLSYYFSVLCIWFFMA